MRTILLIGEDAQLLQSRAVLLSKTHAQVLAAATSEIGPTAGNHAVDLVVLCHSLWPGVRPLVAAEVRRRWPGVCVIQILKSEFESEAAARYADHIVIAGDPAMLIHKANELLNAPQNLNVQRAPQSCGQTGSPKIAS